MNIYFACSITRGREFESIYQDIVAALIADGHEVPTAHLAQSNVITEEQVVAPGDVYMRDVAWIQNCDTLIAEVSAPSNGVGYEIGYALSVGKRVLCIHQAGRKISKMITGNPDAALIIKPYADTAQAVLEAREFLKRMT